MRDLLEAMPGDDAPHAGALLPALRSLCDTAASLGLALVISEDWHALEAVNRANIDSWLPIMHQPNGAGSFWISAVTAAGEVVGTQAGVLVDCSVTSFGDKLSDLTFFYQRPDVEAAHGERCFCASDAAFSTRGQVCYITAGWTHPSVRGRGLFHLIGRAVRFMAWARWAPLWWVGMVAPEVAPVWGAEKAGRRLLEHRPTILYMNPAAGYDYPPLRLLRFCRAGVLGDMQALVRAGHS